jgi:hypothetical protein
VRPWRSAGGEWEAGLVTHQRRVRVDGTSAEFLVCDVGTAFTDHLGGPFVVAQAQIARMS